MLKLHASLLKATGGNDGIRDEGMLGNSYNGSLNINNKSLAFESREYTRYRYKLVSCRSSEKNRYQNALTVCNVPEALVEKQKAKAIRQAKKLLQREGILPIDEPLVS